MNVDAGSAGRARVNRLDLEPAVHVRLWEDGHVVRRRESHFLDLLVHGASLRLSLPDGDGLVTELNGGWMPEVPRAVEVLLGRLPHPDLEDGRVPLLVCGLCGDLTCGAVTVHLEVDDEVVHWSQWRWENGYEPPENLEVLGGCVSFDRANYEAALLAAHRQLEASPFDNMDHRASSHGRFRPPWRWGWRIGC